MFLVGSTVLAVVVHDITASSDVVVLALAVLAGVGLIVLQVRSFSARGELAAALTDAGLPEQAGLVLARGRGLGGARRAVRTILLPGTVNTGDAGGARTQPLREL